MRRRTTKAIHCMCVTCFFLACRSLPLGPAFSFHNAAKVGKMLSHGIGHSVARHVPRNPRRSGFPRIHAYLRAGAVHPA